MIGFMYIVVGIILAVIAGISWRLRFSFYSQKPKDYSTQKPSFLLTEHLSGQLICEGIIFGPFGRVTSRFTADMDAVWQGTRGTIKENFIYDNGRTQCREWTLEVNSHGSIKASASDIIGVGTGWQQGSSVHLNYRIRLPEDSGGHVLDTVDWMYLLENGSIMNRSQFRKYGIKVGELVATIRKKDIK